MMESAFCLNIPLLSSHRGVNESQRSFLSIDENKIVHPAGNTLQISSFPSTSFQKYETKEKRISIIAENEIGRGFSCYCLNNRLKRVAYSARKTNPSICVWSYQKNKILCKIDDGASLEYADISFNLEGSKLVAIGKGEIDATVFVWTIKKEHDNNESQSEFPFQAKLLVKHQLSHSTIQCLFNPLDDTQIALLHENRKSVSMCNFTSIGFKLKFQEKLSTFEEKMEECISTITWESNNTMLIGFSDGSVYSCSDADEMQKLWEAPKDVKYGGVCGIYLTLSYVLVGFRKGHLVWVARNRPISTSKVNVLKEVSINDEIDTFDVNPSYEKVIILTKSGDLMTIPIHINNDKNEDQDANVPTRIAEIHRCLITSLCCVTLAGKASVSLLLSGGFDGKVKAFRDASITPTHHSALACLNIGSPVTCMETFSGNPMCAVGSADGCLRFVHVGKSKEYKEIFGNGSVNLIVLKSEVLTNAPITSLKFVTEGKKLVAGCYESGQAFVLCAEPTNLHVLGMVQTSDKTPICSVSWSNKTEFHLFVGSKQGSLSCYDTSSMCFSPEPIQPIWEVNLHVQCTKGMIVHEFDDYFIAYIAHADICGFDSFVIKIENDEYKLNRVQRFDRFRSISSFMSMEKGVMLVASLSGEFALLKCSNDGNFSLTSLKALHSCPVVSMAFSADHSRIYSVSIDGAIYISWIGTPHPVLQSSHEYDYLLPKNPKRKVAAIENLDKKICDGSGRRMTWMFKATKQLNSEQERQATGTKKILREKIEDVRRQFEKILTENEALDEKDRLKKEELIVDLTDDKVQREKINLSVQSYLEKVQCLHDKDKGALDKIRSEHIENRDTKFHRMSSVLYSSDSFSVVNFPMKRLNEQEKRALKIMGSLRRNEIVEMQRNTIRASNNGLSWSTYIQNSSIASDCLIDDIHKCFDQVKLSKTKTDEGNLFDFCQNSPVEAFRLLYPTLALRTKSQKLTQMFFFRHATRDLMATFNVKFKGVRDKKDKSMIQIHANLDRINDLAKDLGVVPIFNKHQIVEDEKSDICDGTGKSLTSADANVEQKSASMSETSKRGIKSILGRQFNIGMVESRMISGKLALSQKNGDCVNMEQLNMASVDTREKLKENKIQQRHEQLSKEMKRLETDILHISKALNEQLLILDNDYNSVRSALRSNELFYVLLAKSMIDNKDLTKSIAELEVRKDHQILTLEELNTNEYKMAKQQYDHQKNDLLEKINHDKSLDKTFKKSISKLSDEVIDQETLNILYHLFRKRGGDVKGKDEEQDLRNDRMPLMTKRSKIGRQSGRESLSKSVYSVSNNKKRKSDLSTSSADTKSFVHKMKQAIHEAKAVEEHEEIFFSPEEPFPYEIKMENTKTDIASHQLQASDIPEGFEISHCLWSTLLQLRKEKIASEVVVRETTELISHTKRMVDNMEKEMDKLSSSIETFDQKIKALQRKRKVEMTSPSIMLHVKQGQLKVTNLGVEDAILLPTTPVRALDDKVEKLSIDKSKVMKKICNLKAELKKINCKNELLKLKENHEKELHIDFQLMHLTNELKYILNGGTNEMKVQESSIEDQLSSQLNICETKLRKLKKEEKVLRKTIKERSEENVQLEKQLCSLRNTMKSKEGEHEAAVLETDTNLKMKSIMQRSKFMETVRKQGAEICSLRTELDKLRQKTFPSFSE